MGRVTWWCSCWCSLREGLTVLQWSVSQTACFLQPLQSDVYELCLLSLMHFRSPIHGRGLFCKRNIDAGEMVIEYSGNVIRSILTDKREKYYDSKVSSGLLQMFLKSLGELENGCEGRTGPHKNSVGYVSNCVY